MRLVVSNKLTQNSGSVTQNCKKTKDPRGTAAVPVTLRYKIDKSYEPEVIDVVTVLPWTSSFSRRCTAT